MTDLYIRPGIEPQPLPFQAFDPDNRLWTDLAHNEEGREATGWTNLAPTKPNETETQIVVWDSENEEWVMVDRPPVVEPEPDPYAGFIPPSLLRQRAQKIGIWDDLASYLAQYPSRLMMVLTLENGIDPKYPDLINGFNELQVPQEIQDYLLSDPSRGV